MATPDLFPETLLVDCADGQIFTTSLKVAEHFGKNHRDVLKAIKNLLADCPDQDFSLRNFAPRIYQYSAGKGQLRDAPMYHMTEEGFALLAMGFTGPKALQWKIDFLNAFRQMEATLHAQTARFAVALDRLHPCLRPVVEGSEAGLPRLAIAKPLGKSARAITYHRRNARRLGLLG